MIAFPNAKINLGLRILEKRPDGFHNIETVIYPVALFDVLEIVPSDNNEMLFSFTGLVIPGEISNNLCIKAFHLLSSVFHLPPVKIHLHKVIPTGAGLGGGSSDGAFTIKLLNDIFSLGLSENEMMDVARKLGSDCAFFIKNKPQFAYGRGDQFICSDIDLSRFTIKIVTPGIHISTAEAYRMIDNNKSSGTKTKHVMEIIKMPVSEWNGLLINDFEEAVFESNPEIERAKNDYYREGALYASMTGSGSSVYGIFK